MNNMDDKINVKAVLGKSFDVYKNHLTIFLGLSLGCGIINELLSLLFKALSMQSFSISFFINILMTSWITIAIVNAVDLDRRNKKLAINRLLLSARGRYWPFVTVTLATIFAFALGLILFIVPGFYVATIFMFADILVVLEKRDSTQAFKQSMEMTKPHFWQVFQCLFLIMIISSVPSFLLRLSGGNPTQSIVTVSKVLAVVIMPYFVITQVIMYFTVKNINLSERAN